LLDPAAVATVDVWCDRFLSSRIDLDDNTMKNYRSSLAKACKTFGNLDPETITYAAVAEWIGQLDAVHKSGTVRQHFIAFRLLLDFTGVEPNPARDPRVKLPKQVREELNPPTVEHLLAIIRAIPQRERKILFVTIEQGCTRLGETVALTWGDVDRAGLRLRLRRAATKRDRARWVDVPEWLMEQIESLCPFDDRTPDRRIFQGITEAAAYQTMARACQAAGVPHYHPHDLRHRRASLWHGQGMSIRELMERGGWSSSDIAIDTYSHVMPLDEVSVEAFEVALR
jgi:integrase